MRGVAIGGFMGAGKSTVGQALAEALAIPFVDLDLVLEARHGSIQQQFVRDGEAAFREREASLIRDLDDGVARVIATGGGAWVDPANRRVLGRRCLTVVLDAPLEVLRDRVGRGEGRPLWDAAVARRYVTRREAYRDADLVVDVAVAGIDQIVDRIVAAVGVTGGAHRVEVALGDRSYPVHVVPGRFEGLTAALDDAGVGSDVAVVCDRESRRFHGEALAAELGAGGRSGPWIEPAHGEANKTLRTWRETMDALLVPGFHRRTAVLALGGGVVGDIAGFVAATALRGVPLVQIPTTLLAMVDSSVGGKTGVNHASGKNLVGAFHQPALVWAGLGTLATLPREELRCGLAEALKTGLLADGDLVDRLEEHGRLLGAGAALDRLGPVVARCVAIKAAVVEQDEREAGRRALLNLGHTLAHGLEAALGGGAIRHGEAVSIGLVHEARWAVAHGHCEDDALPARIARIAASMGLPVDPPVTDRDAVLAAMRLDKKASSDRVSLPVPVRSGSATLVDLALDRLDELLPTRIR